MKNESLIASGLYGTWTFVTQTMTDIGYYKGRAYFIMHLMPDPMQVHSCQLKDCVEQSNHLCQKTIKEKTTDSVTLEAKEEKECINTENSIAEWSDVTAFFQFGFQLRTGIAFKTYTMMNTSDWLGPYNLVMAPMSRKVEMMVVDSDPTDWESNSTDTSDESTVHKRLYKFVSRYVTTEASNHIQLPPDATIIQPEMFDQMAGVLAINQTIQAQQLLHTRQDPYATYHETCVKGDIPAAILPRIELGMMTTTTDEDVISSNARDATFLETESSEIAMFRVDFSMLSLPDPKSKLYKLWPSLKKHLGSQFPLEGPYCYGNDPKRGYAIQLGYDSAFDGFNNQSWKVVKGCLPDLPCWSDEGPFIPYDNGSSGQYVLDPTGVTSLVCYLLALLLMISLIFNCQLSNQLKLVQERRQEDERDDHEPVQYMATPSGRPVPQQQVFDAFNDLEEPLLRGNSNDPIRENAAAGSGAEETKIEAD